MLKKKVADGVHKGENLDFFKFGFPTTGTHCVCCLAVLHSVMLGGDYGPWDVDSA